MQLQGGGQGIPGGIAALLGQTPPEQEQKDPLQAVQDAIENIHELMVTVTDPADVNVIAGCLKALTGVQQRLMQKSQSQGQ